MTTHRPVCARPDTIQLAIDATQRRIRMLEPTGRVAEAEDEAARLRVIRRKAWESMGQGRGA